MSGSTDQSEIGTNELRVVIDAQVVLSMFLIHRNLPEINPAKRALLGLLNEPQFCWLWTPDIITDYERGAGVIGANERLNRRFWFDLRGFQLFLTALQLSAPVVVSATTLRRARQRISQAPRRAEQDLEDAIYLACAVDGDAHLLTSEDSDLRMLGNTYEGVRIVRWAEMKQELLRRGLWIDQTI